ncbi:hypothetical protein NSA19_10590 [Actinomyces bowdenii]|uniref:hypothetical protein n=1 Tax=Actinomyces bowdenii TaxID=131109 RepID=UPI00214C3169|nr:hypothetical protein [Actinomyces bowdenii]MCR2053275.1 hypothetical protein [Actinomyces bowdenii]
MTRSPLRSRLTRAVVGALIAGAALAGCSAHPGQAAVITYTDAQGQRQELRLSEDRVQAIASELGPLGVHPDQVVQALADAPFIEEAAQAHGLSVSAQEAREALDAAQAQSGAAAVDSASLSEGAVDIIRMSLLSNELSQLPQAQEIQAQYQSWRGSAQAIHAPRYQSQSRPWILGGGPSPLQG